MNKSKPVKKGAAVMRRAALMGCTGAAEVARDSLRPQSGKKATTPK